MGIFEGYVGIRLWDGQLVDDVMFSLLFVLFVSFAIVFRANYRLFIKMVRDVIFVKERQSLFEVVKGNEGLFRNFMTFQALFLSTLSVFAIARSFGYFGDMGDKIAFTLIISIFIISLLFYWFKRSFYYLFGVVFTDANKYNFWKTNYNAIIGAWGVSMYFPAIWLLFVDSGRQIALALFVMLYILCRFVIIYKTIRIFYKKNSSLLYISFYLCGLEIMPLVLLYGGIVYLYNFIESSTLWQ